MQLCMRLPDMAAHVCLLAPIWHLLSGRLHSPLHTSGSGARGQHHRH